MDWKFAKKIFSFFLAWLMLNPSGPPSGFAKDDAAKDARQASDVKAAVLKLGAGKDARVMLILRDGERVGGYLQETQEEGFSVSVFCSGNDIPVLFARVEGLRGLNVATGARVSVGKGISAKAAARLADNDPCGTTIIEAGPSGAGPSGPQHGELIGGLIFIGFLATILIVLVVAHGG